jgi:DNA-binding LacI/PurR family transcriptional regulator
MSLGVIQALASRGARVPQDVSIVGFDDIPESEYFSPPLTTMRQDFSELGREIMAGVLEVLKDEDSHEHTGSVPQLIVRESTSAPRA